MLKKASFGLIVLALVCGIFVLNSSALSEKRAAVDAAPLFAQVDPSAQIAPVDSQQQMAQLSQAVQPIQSSATHQHLYFPGWRPSPDLLVLPPSPFATSNAIVTTPRFYEQEARALAERIRGVVRIGSGYALFMDNQLIRQGMQVPLNPPIHVGSSAGASASSQNRSSNAQRPTQTLASRRGSQSQGPTTSTISSGLDGAVPKEIYFLFSGLNEDHTHAIFKLDQADVEVLLPSAQKTLEKFSGSIEKMKRVAPAVLLGYDGYFITSAEQVPDPGAIQKISIKTQAGFFKAVILKKNPLTQLALGRMEPAPDLPLPTWHLPENPMEDSSFAMAFDPNETASFARPKPFFIEKAKENPRWLVGAPLFENKKMVGILGAKNQKLTLFTYNEVLRMFPELIDADRDARVKQQAELSTSTAASKPASTSTKLFFNPEQHIGAVCIYLSESSSNSGINGQNR